MDYKKPNRIDSKPSKKKDPKAKPPKSSGSKTKSSKTISQMLKEAEDKDAARTKKMKRVPAAKKLKKKKPVTNKKYSF